MYYLKGKRDILLTNFYFCAQIFREVKVWSRTLVGAKQFYRSKSRNKVVANESWFSV